MGRADSATPRGPAVADRETAAPQDHPDIDVGMDLIEDLPDRPEAPADIACPNEWCGSEIGERCVNMSQMRAGMVLPQRVPFHPARIKARKAAAAAAQGAADDLDA